MTSETATTESGDDMKNYDFSALTNVELINADLGSMTDEQLSVLYAQAKYCQSMTDADIDTMRELVSENMTYIHMSGMTQNREEYFADIADGSLRYFSIGMATPAQISLTWMLHKYPNVVPIPGSKNKERIIENLNSADVELTDEEFKALDSELAKHKVYGHRGLGGF